MLLIVLLLVATFLWFLKALLFLMGITCTITGVLGFICSFLSLFIRIPGVPVIEMPFFYMILSIAVTIYGLFCLWLLFKKKSRKTTNNTTSSSDANY